MKKIIYLVPTLSLVGCTSQRVEEKPNVIVILADDLGFGALGLAGFFANKKHGLQIGYIVAVFGRYVFAVISGVVFFGAYAPEGTPAIVYSLTYNATYIVPEAIATLIVISLPPVAKALAQVKKNALSA